MFGKFFGSEEPKATPPPADNPEEEKDLEDLLFDALDAIPEDGALRFDEQSESWVPV